MADLGESVGTGAALGSVIPGVGNVLGGALGGISSILGGALGAIFGGGQRQQAYDALNKANNIIQQLQLPPDQAQAVLLNQFKTAGLYTPQLVQAVQQAGNAYNGVKQDPGLLQAQQQALQQMQQYSKTGLNAQDRLASQQLQNQVGAQIEGQRKSILQNAQAMGQGGGGAGLAAQLQALQGQANNASQNANQQAAAASQRAMQALSSSSDMANQLQNQGLTLAQNKAQAQNEMNRFNTGNQLALNQANAGIQNQAGLYNQQNAQSVGNANTQQANQELYRQLQGRQQDFQNATGLAQQQANSLGNLANMYNGQAANTQQQFSGIGAGVGQIATGIQNNQNNQNLLEQLKQFNSGNGVQNY